MGLSRLSSWFCFHHEKSKPAAQEQSGDSQPHTPINPKANLSNAPHIPARYPATYAAADSKLKNVSQPASIASSATLYASSKPSLSTTTLLDDNIGLPSVKAPRPIKGHGICCNPEVMQRCLDFDSDEEVVPGPHLYITWGSPPLPAIRPPASTPPQAGSNGKREQKRYVTLGREFRGGPGSQCVCCNPTIMQCYKDLESRGDENVGHAEMEQNREPKRAQRLTIVHVNPATPPPFESLTKEAQRWHLAWLARDNAAFVPESEVPQACRDFKNCRGIERTHMHLHHDREFRTQKGQQLTSPRSRAMSFCTVKFHKGK